METPVLAQKYGTLYKGATPHRTMYRQPVARDACPTYQFRSTSAYSSSFSGSAYATQVTTPYATRAAGSKPRRSNPWDEDAYDDEGNPQGQEVGMMYTPIGEPFILLMMALFYLVYKAISHQSSAVREKAE
jgi:hypothetical protein